MSFSRSTSPLPLPANHRRDCMSAATKRYKYLRRMFKLGQMDFEFAMWQMVYLCIAPHKVYRNFQYRKRKYNNKQHYHFTYDLYDLLHVLSTYIPSQLLLFRLYLFIKYLILHFLLLPM